MPDVTKRLLTDETGQSIVTALGALTNVVDPNGTTVAAAQKLNNMTVSATVLPAGATPTSSLTEVNGHFHLTLGVPVELPTVDSNDDGKFLMVEDGAWSPVSLGEGSGLMTDEEKEKLDNLGEIDIYKTTESASIASFADGADGMPLRSLSVAIEPVQDLHGYDSPWPSGGGKNIYSGIIGTDRFNNGPESTHTTNQDELVITIGTASLTGAYADAASIIRTLLANTAVKSVSCDIKGSSAFPIIWGNDSTGGSVTLTTNWQRVKIDNYSGQVLYFYCRNADGAYTGNTISIRNLMVEASATATDTYAPYSNICPISGWTGAKVQRTGKNLLKVKYPGRSNNGITYTTNTDGTISVSGTATDYSYFAPNYGFSQQYMTLLPRGTYSLKSSGATSSINVYGAFFDTNGNYKGTTSSDAGDGTIFNISEDFAWFSPQIFITSGTSVSMNMEIMLELGSTATAYEPYSGSTYDITFPSSAGTVYGGTLTIHQDGSGELVVDHASIDLGTVTWTEVTVTDRERFFGPFTGGKPGSKVICDCFQSGTRAEVFYHSKDNVIAMRDDDSQFEIHSSIYENDYDAVGFKTQMSGHYAVYELATPQTYTLTPQEIRTLLGTNNIWADTGNVSLEYPAETTGLINTYDKVKIDTIPTKVSQLQNDSGYINSNPEMTGATSEDDGTSGLVPAPSAGDEDKFLSGDGTYKSGGLPMVILSYGNSTWSDFINAYRNNVIVYCRASSNANPATGSQTRMAFMAYVNDDNNPNNVEFQYYRSMNPNNKTINQLSDQVYVYKLTSSGTWSVEVREASLTSIVFDASSGLTGTYNKSTGTLTIAAAT